MIALTRQSAQPWLDPESYWTGLSTATAQLDTPIGAISLPALAHNAFDMLDRAAGRTIRVASKSVRVRGVLEAVLAVEGYQGVLAFTLPEAIWLAETIDDVVLGYPTADRAALAALLSSEKLAGRITLMVDSVAHLDYIDAIAAPGKRENIRVAIDLDASWNSRLLGFLGVYRSPIHEVGPATDFARAIVERPGFTLVGMMSYEAQIAGVTNRPTGRPFLARTVDYVQWHSTT